MIEWCTQLRDCGGKYQVEEQIGPARATHMAFLCGANFGRAEKGHKTVAGGGDAGWALDNAAELNAPGYNINLRSH
jgi:hypothetical protein